MFTYSELHRLVGANLGRLPRDIDLVVGIPRSGLMPAAHIATSKQIPLASTEQLIPGETGSFGGATLRRVRPLVSSPKHVLLVDDTCSTGLRVEEAKSQIESAWPGIRITSLTVLRASNSEYSPDIYLGESRTPRIFAWNMFCHPSLTQYVAVDLDGVICVDPTPEENDDGDQYLEFILGASPKARIMEPVLAVVTGRLENYRLETARWLQGQSVSCLQLLMNDAPSADFRRRSRIRHRGREYDQISWFKAEAIRSLKPLLFVESNGRQARNIHELTGCPVYSYDEDLLLGGIDYQSTSASPGYGRAMRWVANLVTARGRKP